MVDTAAALLFGQFAVTLVLVAAVSWWAARRLGVPAVIWVAGAVTFVASQVLRMPPAGRGGPRRRRGPRVTLGAVVTSGGFEEGARYAALRWVVKRARRAADGIVFGLGHGGIEAVLLLGITAVRAVVQRNAVWLLAAAGFDILVNGVALVVAERYGILGAELAMTGFAVAAALVIHAAWRNRAAWYPMTVATDS